MNRLLLVQHITFAVMCYHGFTVKPGMYYGVVKTPFGCIYAAWSGWTWYNGCIALYTKLNGEWSMRWADSDEIDFWYVCSATEEWDNTQFFAA